MSEYVRVCRDCGEEYRAGVARCSDCGGELQDLQLDDDGNPIAAETGPPSAVAAVAAAEHRVVFVTAQARELVPLADTLREAAIEYHLVEQPATSNSAPRYALLVEQADEAAARRALAPLFGQPQEEADAGEERSQEAGDSVSCPACGAGQPPGALECAECGLVFGAETENTAVCSRCGSPLPSAGASCPACPPD